MNKQLMSLISMDKPMPVFYHVKILKTLFYTASIHVYTLKCYSKRYPNHASTRIYKISADNVYLTSSFKHVLESQYVTQ